jgi:hypothetical protein
MVITSYLVLAPVLNAGEIHQLTHVHHWLHRAIHREELQVMHQQIMYLLLLFQLHMRTYAAHT